MLPAKRTTLLTSLAVCLLLPLASCANSPLGETLQRTVAADPRLEENPVVFGGSDNVAVPADFPAEIPLYPEADLLAVELPTEPAQRTRTRWVTPDQGDRVRQFYQDAFQSEDWQILPQSEEVPADQQQLVAVKDGLQVTLEISASNQTPAQNTEFILEYVQDDTSNSDIDSDITSVQPDDLTAPIPQPGDSNFIGPVPLPDADQPDDEPAVDPVAPQGFTDLDQAPEELQQYIEDLAELGILNLTSGDSDRPSSTGGEFKPNQTITRREYARWLVAVNNRIYGDRPAQRIRLGTQTAQPAFQDVPRTDPDFAAIQGLAEAGLIPSPLSGDATTVTFRPDAPLTRENLILWKIPVDIRQTLPNATIDAVQQTWGFQDATQIEPRALRAVLADFQNGDLANIRRAFGYTTLFQPRKTVTRAEAAAVLWYFGAQGDGISVKDALQTQQSNESAS